MSNYLWNSFGILFPAMQDNSDDFHVNAVGRRIPKFIPGYGETIPFAGAFKAPPPPEAGAPFRPRYHLPGTSKLCTTLDEALQKTGIEDGWSIGYNHDLRMGDAGLIQVVEACARLGIKDLVLVPTALFACHAPLKEFLENGTIRRIEGSLNGPLGKYISEGNMNDISILRSHGGRAAAVTIGRVPIDLTIVCATASDEKGNANGVSGPNKMGTLGYSQYELPFSKHSIVITDTIVTYPCFPPQISQVYVDFVVKLDTIGDCAGMSTGSVEVREREPELSISKAAVDVLVHSGIVKSGVVIQSGSGAASILTLKQLTAYCIENDISITSHNGGSTILTVEMLRSGVLKHIATAQCFDSTTADSLIQDYPNHVETTTLHLYSVYTAGCLAHDQDLSMISAVEIDVEFNVNANVHSDGYLQHGIGGHQDAACAKNTIVMCPTFRKSRSGVSNPIVIDRVTAVTTPGEVVDIVVTEAGVAVNPRRPDLLEKLSKSDVKLVSMEYLRDVASDGAGRSYEPPAVSERIVSVIEWRDGTVIDVIYGVKK